MLLPRNVEPQTREELVDSLREFQGLEISTPEKDVEKDHGGVLGKMFETYMGASGGNSSDPDLRKLKCELKTKLLAPSIVIDAKWIELMNISPEIDEFLVPSPAEGIKNYLEAVDQISEPVHSPKSLRKYLVEKYGWKRRDSKLPKFEMLLWINRPNSRGFFLTVDHKKVGLCFDPKKVAEKVDKEWLQGKEKESLPLYWTLTKLEKALSTKFPNLGLGIAQGNPLKNPKTFLFHTIGLYEELTYTLLSRLFREGWVKVTVKATETSLVWEFHAKISELGKCYKKHEWIIEPPLVRNRSRSKFADMERWGKDLYSGNDAKKVLKQAKQAVAGKLVEGKLVEGKLVDSAYLDDVPVEDRLKDSVPLDDVPVGYILVDSLLVVGVLIGHVIKNDKLVDRVRVGGVQQEVKNMVQGIKNIQAALDVQTVLKEVESIIKNIQGVQEKAREAKKCADSIQQYENIAPLHVEEARRWAGSAENAAEDTQFIKIALDTLVRAIRFSQDALVKVKSDLSIEVAKEQADFVRIWVGEAEKFTQEMQIQIKPSERFLDKIPVQVMLTQIVGTAQEYLRTIQALLAVLDERAKAVQEAKDALDYVPLVEQVVRETLAMLSPKAVQERATHIKSMVQDAQNHTTRAKEYMKAAQYYEKKVKEMSEIQGKSGKEAEA